MIDHEDLAEGLAALNTLGWLPSGAPVRGILAVVAAAKAYQSAIASQDELSAALWGCVQFDFDNGLSASMRGELSADRMRAALTVAKIKSCWSDVAKERKVCANIALHACLVPPDGGSPSEEERLVCETIAALILDRGKE